MVMYLFDLEVDELLLDFIVGIDLGIINCVLVFVKVFY